MLKNSDRKFGVYVINSMLAHNVLRKKIHFSCLVYKHKKYLVTKFRMYIWILYVCTLFFVEKGFFAFSNKKSRENLFWSSGSFLLHMPQILKKLCTNRK